MIAQQFMDPELLIIIGCIIVALILLRVFSNFLSRHKILKIAVVNLVNCSLFLTGVRSPLLYLLITVSDRPEDSDNIFCEQFSSFRYLFKTSLKFIIHRPFESIIQHI